MASESIDVQFTLAPSDVRAFVWTQLARRWWFLLAWIVTAIVIVFISNLVQEPVYYWLCNRGLSEDLAYSLVTWASPVIIWGALIGGLIIRQRNSVKAKSVAYLPQQWTVSSAGLRVVREGIVVDIAWKAVRELRQRRRYIFFFVDKAQAFVVPAHAFASPTDFTRFNETVQSYFKIAHPDAA